ncbi:MAG TPA: hypothetical protein GYA05_05515 [Acholeplasmataceae bacterium]|jgi:hypothetical protein|nr:hypothetical protein [Acholeplasmataceae bacterium]
MKNYFVTKTDNGYRFYIIQKEGKRRKKKKKPAEEIGLELLHQEKYRGK